MFRTVIVYILLNCLFVLFFLIQFINVKTINAQCTSQCNVPWPGDDDWCSCPPPASREACGSDSEYCPGPCGVATSGTYCSIGGSCGSANFPYSGECVGRWCHCWQYCCNVCSPGDCGTPITCSCTAWQPAGGCGTGGCAVNEKPETRTCDPAGCSATTRCVADSACTNIRCSDCSDWVLGVCGVNGCGPSERSRTRTCEDCVGCGCNDCVLSDDCINVSQFIIPDVSVNEGATTTALTPTIVVEGGANILQVQYSVSPAGVASICDSSQANCGLTQAFITTTPPYGFKVTGLAVSPPTTTITARVDLDYGNIFDTTTSLVTVNGCIPEVSDITIPTGMTSTYFRALVKETGGMDTSLQFNLPDTSIAAICDPSVSPCSTSTYTDSSLPFAFNITGNTVGSAVLSTICSMPSIGYTSPPFLSNVTVSAGAWWQAWGGDILSRSSILSNIPVSTCTEPDGSACKLISIYQDLYEPIPGIAISRTVPQTGGGVISSTLWNAQSYLMPNLYNYAKLLSRVPNYVVRNNLSSPYTFDQSVVNSGTQSDDSYFWYFADSDVNTAGDIDTDDKKVILFVNGNLNIEGKVNLNAGNIYRKGFFIAIVSGSVIINSSVGGVTPPALEGIYVIGGSFNTGSGNNQLRIRGSVTANGLSLQRVLVDNSATPAVIFDYAPDQALLYPASLGEYDLSWKEVAP